MERRQALVEAAYRRLADTGFEGLRLRDVANEVGIDHSTIHYHFPTKEDLVAAVVDHATRQFWTAPRPEGPPAEKLRRHLVFLGRMIVERPELHAVLREVDLRASRDPQVREIVAEREAGWRRSLTEMLAEGERQGAWPPALDVAAGAELIIAAVKGASLDAEHAGQALLQLERLLIPGEEDPR